MSPLSLASILAALGLAGCGAGPTEASLPWPAVAVPVAPEPSENPSTAEKIALGRLLFYDPILSSDRATACATCHSEEWGMADGMEVSVGVGGRGATGPGRTGVAVGRRNALTLWNAAWRASLFWDGRAASLEDQVLAPLEQPLELDRAPDAVAADLAAVPEYASRFAAAFPAATPAVTVVNLQRAIAAFERTLVSDRAPYDQYVAGDPGALDGDARRGMDAFARAGCADCHAPPLFEGPGFANRGVAPRPGVADEGRFEATGDPADRGAFRVPTLRNIRETGPYFHSGAVDTLDAAVRAEASRAPTPLADDEITAIVTFLQKGLIDPSRSPDRPATVPSGLPVPVDGFRIPR